MLQFSWFVLIPLSIFNIFFLALGGK